MQVTGLRIIARNYDFEGSSPFKTEDIVGLTPLVSAALLFTVLPSLLSLLPFCSFSFLSLLLSFFLPELLSIFLS